MKPIMTSQLSGRVGTNARLSACPEAEGHVSFVDGFVGSAASVVADPKAISFWLTRIVKVSLCPHALCSPDYNHV